MTSETAHITPITAHATDTRHNQNHNQQWCNKNNQPCHNQNNNHGNSNNQQRLSKPSLGRCQACGIQGHSAKYCPEFCTVRGSASAPQNQQCNNNSWNNAQQIQHQHPSDNAQQIQHWHRVLTLQWCQTPSTGC